MNHPTFRLVSALLLILTALTAARGDEAAATAAQATPAATDDDRAVAARLIDAVQPSLARIEYSLQYDNGQQPYGSGWATRCPNCGRFHGDGTASLVSDERPAETAGFIIAPDRVLAPDFMMHPRFISRISVRFGDQVADATIANWYRDHKAVVLQLDKPLTDARPLAFAAAEGPYFAITHVHQNGAWQTTAKPLGGALTAIAGEGPRFIPVDSNALIVSRDGTPITVAANDQLPADDSWKTAPAAWQVISRDEMQARLQRLQQRVDSGVLRVQLNLRSPRQQETERFSFRRDEQSATERQALGVVIAPNQLLVLAELDARTTARLERITVHLPDGATRPARFEASLADYGAMIVAVDAPLDGVIELADGDIRSHRNALLLQAEIKLQGDKRVVHTGHRRIPAFEVGWRRQIFPELPGGENDRFLFDDDGRLVVLPIIKRPKAGTERGYGSNDPVQTAAVYLRPILADIATHSDPAIVPLSETEEFRLAWLGAEMQPLTADLARMNNVSDLTDQGENGVLITYIYPGSPAEKAGLAVGNVLLRIHLPGRPDPVDLTVDEYQFSDRPFPWDRYDQLPEQYFDQIPRPWPTIETPLARTLTEVGFGKSFELEYAVDGKAQRKTFTIEQSPTHYDTAAKATVEPLGLTVREMTFEVRRYFQRKADEPGVIISHIDAGSRASKAGLKPYEFITHVNDQPVATPAEFQRLTEGGDVRLAVRRYTRGRVVKITLDAPATTAPATTAPATGPAAVEQAD